jgi:hypothetical protein
MNENTIKYKFCMGTCSGQYLGFSSSAPRSNRSLVRLLAGVVNLNAAFLSGGWTGQDNSAACARWVELQLNGERVVIHPLALSGYDIFLSIRTPISCSPCHPQHDFIRLQLAHIVSLMLSPPHEVRLAKVLQCMHSHHEMLAIRGTYAETAGAGTCDDLAEIINAHWTFSANPSSSSNYGADALADVDLLLESLEAFEDGLVNEICHDAPWHYQYMLEPLMQLLGEEPGKTVLGLHLFHAPPLEGPGQIVSLVYSAESDQEQEDDGEAAAAARACRRWESHVKSLQLGDPDEDTSRTGRTLVFLPNADGIPSDGIGTEASDEVRALIVASCGGGREDLVLVATVPACSCTRTGAERIIFPGSMPNSAQIQELSGEKCYSLHAWPISVLSLLLRLAWQESIQRIGETFHTSAPTSAFEHMRRTRPADARGTESSPAHLGVSTGVVSDSYTSPVGVGLLTSPHEVAKHESAVTPREEGCLPGLVGETETRGKSELRTPARVPAPPSMPPSTSASAIKSRAGRTLRLAD